MNNMVREDAIIKIEEELDKSRKSAALLASLFENSYQPFGIGYPDGRLGLFNSAFEELTGYSREELKSTDWSEILTPHEFRDIENEKLEELQRTGKPVKYEKEYIRKDSTRIPIELLVHLVKNEDGTPEYYYSFITDITERKKAEKELRMSQVYLVNAMDLANLASWEFDVSNNQYIFNDRFYSMFGTTAEKEGGYTMSVEDYSNKYIHPEDVQFIVDGMKKTLKAQESAFGTNLEHRIIRSDEKTRYMAVRIRIVRATKNHGAYAYGTIQDITKIKIAEKGLKESIGEKEILLKEIHHRVKNNLMIISSLLSLQSRYIEDKASQEMFKESQNRARSMALIHERLYQSTDLKRINFGDYIRSLATELFNTYGANFGHIKLKINVEDIFLDINTAIPLGLIVNEIITNSLTHAFPEGKTGEINVEFHPKDDHYEFTVKDDGIGFPDDIEFQTTDSLGLQLIINLTDQINGDIELDRSNGTALKITFKELEYKNNM